MERNSIGTGAKFLNTRILMKFYSMPEPADADTGRQRFESLPRRIGLGQFMNPTEERLKYIRQLGVEDILLNMYQYDPDYPHMPDDMMPLERDTVWSYEDLKTLRENIESAGVRLNAIENVPISFYDDVMLGRPGRDEQLENLKQTIRNIGKAGIPMFGYHWSPTGVMRTDSVTVDGGAEVSAYDHSEIDDTLAFDREYTEAEFWSNYEYFLEEIVPVAEEAGVKLCLHPNDPPVESRNGVPQLFRNFENFKRAMEMVPSDYHGLDLCLGTWSQMGEDVLNVIEYFGERDKIFYVHFRDVAGSVPLFHETWIDRGNYDPLAVMKAFDKVGFSGVMIPDHTPHLIGDTDWDHRGRAYTVGYMKCLQDCVEKC